MLSHKNLDFQKYDHCIQTSTHPLIYAESTYLDIVTNKSWDALVWGDYEAVMPIPYARLKRHFFQNRIVQPSYCQQLGVFHPENFSEEIEEKMYEKFISLKPYNYAFHAHSSFGENQSKLTSKNNFILSLKPDYEELFANFSRSKRQRVRKAHQNDLVLKPSDDIKGFLNFYKQNQTTDTSTAKQNLKETLIQQLSEKGQCNLYFVYHDGALIAASVLLFAYGRIHYLFAVSNEEGRDLLAIDYLLGSVMEEYAGTEWVFDFEGSELPGVAKFMQSFGAVNEPYFVLA